MKVSETGERLSVTTGRPPVFWVLVGCALAVLIAGVGKAAGAGMTGGELGWAVGMVLFLLGAAWLIGEKATFVLTRTGDCFQWSHYRFGRSETGKVPLGSVRKARRDVLKDSEGDLFRLVVETDSKVIPLSKSYGNDPAGTLREIAERINRFAGLP